MFRVSSRSPVRSTRFATLVWPAPAGLCRLPDTFRQNFGLNPPHVRQTSRSVQFGSFRLNPAERSRRRRRRADPAQRKVYDTLLFMVERPGRLLKKQALLDAVWKGAVVEENTLSRTISTLRQILGERGGEHRYIETVSGIGYRFVAPVAVTAQPARATPPPVRTPCSRCCRSRISAASAIRPTSRTAARGGRAEPAHGGEGPAADSEELSSFRFRERARERRRLPAASASTICSSARCARRAPPA